MTKHESFPHWLTTQTDRNDPVGDIAREAAQDPSFPKEASATAAITYLTARSERAGRAACEAMVAWRRSGAPPYPGERVLAECAASLGPLLEAAGYLLVEADRPRDCRRLLEAIVDVKNQLEEAINQAALEGSEASLDAICDVVDSLSRAVENR